MSESPRDPSSELTALLAPAGAPPVADDERYHRLRAVIEAQSALTPTPIDWPELTHLAAAMLRERAPDLLIAAAFAIAQHRLCGLDGLHRGLDLLEHLLRDRISELTPQRPRGRAAALAWYLAETARDLAAHNTLDHPSHQALRARLRALRELSAQRLAEHAPSFSDLLRQLDSAAPPPDAPSPPKAPSTPPSPLSASSQTTSPLPRPPTPAPEDPPPSSSTPASQPSAAPGPTPTNPPLTEPSSALSHPGPALDPKLTPERMLRGQAEALITLAHQLRSRDLRDPRAYRALRVGLWLHLTAPPPSRDGRTTIPPLAPPLLARLDDLAARADWPELIEALERAAPAHCFALTLHRRLALALTALDAPQAAAEVQHQTRALLHRLPELGRLHDTTGAPLLDPAARAWLCPPNDPLQQPQPAPSAPADPQAHHSPSRGDHDHGERAAFLRRLSRAESHTAADRLPEARLILRGLEPLIAQHHLDRWEPQLARRALLALVRAEAFDPPAREGHLIRLAALDPDALAGLC